MFLDEDTPSHEAQTQQTTNEEKSQQNLEEDHELDLEQADCLSTLPEDSGFSRSCGSLAVKQKFKKPTFKRRFTDFVSRRVSTKSNKESRSTSVHFPPSRPAHLDDTSKEDKILCKLIDQSFSYLNRPHILKEEGLFRIPGNGTEVRQLTAAFKAGKEVDLSEVCDPNTIASLLKHHFKNLREPLVSLKVQREIVLAMREADVAHVKTILKASRAERFSSLQTMIDILTKVIEYSEYNKMSLPSMGTACGLSIFNGMTPTNANDMLIFILHHKDEIFS